MYVLYGLLGDRTNLAFLSILRLTFNDKKTKLIQLTFELLLQIRSRLSKNKIKK